MREDLFGVEDAQRQQSADIIADFVVKMISGELPVEQGEDVQIVDGDIISS